MVGSPSSAALLLSAPAASLPRPPPPPSLTAGCCDAFARLQERMGEPWAKWNVSSNRFAPVAAYMKRTIRDVRRKVRLMGLRAAAPAVASTTPAAPAAAADAAAAAAVGVVAAAAGVAAAGGKRVRFWRSEVLELRWGFQSPSHAAVAFLLLQLHLLTALSFPSSRPKPGGSRWHSGSSGSSDGSRAGAAAHCGRPCSADAPAGKPQVSLMNGTWG